MRREQEKRDYIKALIEEVKNREGVQRRLKEKYPEDKKLLLQCQTAIGMRREQEKRDYIKALIEEVKNREGSGEVK